MYRDLVDIAGFYVTYNISVASIFVDPLDLAVAGILGLGSDSRSLVYEMYLQGNLSQPIYSLYSGDANSNYLILDTPDFSDLGLNVISTDVLFYNESLQAVFRLEGKEYESTIVEFSSINSYIVGPYEQLHYFYQKLQEYGCYYFEEYMVCDCEGSYPDMEFLIQSVTLIVSSQVYLMTVFDK